MLHPIVEVVGALIDEDADGHLILSEDAVSRIRIALTELEDSEGPTAVRGLTALASHLSQERAERELARTLLRLALERFASANGE